MTKRLLRSSARLSLRSALWVLLISSAGAAVLGATDDPVPGTLSNRGYRLTVTLQADGVQAVLDDRLLELRVADGPYLYRAVSKAPDGTEQTFARLEQARVAVRGDRLTIHGRLGPLEVEHDFVLPETKPWMEERIRVKNPTAGRVAFETFEAGFQRRVADASGQVQPELQKDRWVAVPMRARATDPKGHVNDFAIADLLAAPGYEPRVDKDQRYTQVPSPHRHSEGWAWSHGNGTLGLFVFNQENMLFSVVSVAKRPDGAWLRFGGACMISGEPAALTRIEPGQTVDLGTVRYHSVKGGYTAAMYAFRALLDEKGCRFPPDYNPPVHWEQLYDMPEAWNDRPQKYTRAIVEREAAKGRDYSCEALYLDPGWDTDFGTFLWGEGWLGPRRPFIDDMRAKYGLEVALHCPLATWMSHAYSWGIGAVKTWPAAATRRPPVESLPEAEVTRLEVPAVLEGRRNLALRPGAKASASSVYQDGAMPIHQVAHLNDGWYGNGRSWIAGRMPAWAEVDLGDVFEIAAVGLGNDHARQYTDRAVTDLRVRVATEHSADPMAATWRTVAEHHGEPLQAALQIAFPAVRARWVRIELLLGGGDLPRLDEIEVYEAQPVADAAAKAFAESVRRGPKPKPAEPLLGPLLCLGARQYLDEAEKRLLANCADGVVFLMFDGNWWNGGCLDPAHGHPVPYRIEDHTRACLDLAQRVHARYPKVLIEMHDTIAGGSPARVTPVYYKYGLAGSYDENWGFELMWDPFADLREARGRSVYYYNLGCNVPLYLHIDLRKDNEHAVVLWWFASTIRHLGIGGTSPSPAVVEAHKAAMKRYRELDRFYKRGEFYGMNEEVHVHVLPGERAFVVNVFNLSDQPRTIEGSLDLGEMGLDRDARYSVSEDWASVAGGACRVRLAMPAWSARLAVVRAP